MSSANVILSTDLSSSIPVHSTPAKRRPAASDKKSSERFYCPYEGCNRSFAELWRLKVHYRASPDVRGSGKERGHGAELESCPKCGAELKPGRHHVGCTGGKHSAVKNERKRISRSKKHVESSAAKDTDLKEGVNSSTTAIGVPVSWLPLDFDQFFLPIGAEFSPVFLRPRRQHLHGMNLVYGNLGERPSMVTTQIGMEPDFGSLSFIKEEAPSSLASFTTGLESLNEAVGSGVGGVGVIDNDSNLSFGQNAHHYEALEASLFDDSFDSISSPPEAVGIEQRKENLYDSRKRDRGQSQEMEINKPKSKYIAASLLSKPTSSKTSSSSLTPPIDSFFESPSFRTSKTEDSSFLKKCNGSGFRHVGGESPLSFFLNQEGGFNPNPKADSLKSDDSNHFNSFMHDFNGMEFQNPLITDESKGLKSKEEKISN